MRIRGSETGKPKAIREKLMTDRGGIFAQDDPFDLLGTWLAEARERELNDPDAMAVATVDSNGCPNVRLVLLKEIESNGLVFYTNLESRKAQEIYGTGWAAVAIHWKSVRRQVRARGKVERVGDEQADRYFATRSPASRVGAWASRQSRPLENRAELMSRARQLQQEFGDDPPRPEFWGGFRIVPFEFEFWANGADRLHDRFRWSRAPEDSSSSWSITRLNP